MNLSIADVCVLCCKTPGPSENYARKIAEFLGADVAFVPTAGVCDLDSLQKLVPQGGAVIAHADVLAQLVDAIGTDVGPVISAWSDVFLYGFTTSARHAALISRLSSGSLLGVERPASTETAFRVAQDQSECCGQLSGLQIRSVDHTKDFVFRPGKSASVHAAFIEIGVQPFFAQLTDGTSRVFLAGSSELADLDQEVNSLAGMLPWFSRLGPLLMFLKKFLGPRAWHSDRSQACFIIDDPLLTPRYGFLNYEKLLEATRGQKFSTSIAFIPWNYQRSRQAIADLFLKQSGSLSLCVHGCDHTKAEFASADANLLLDKARLALHRMKAHTQRSSVPFDDVMVFPQGLFSSEAIQALARAGYVAAVNTDLCPSNRPQSLPLRNLMDVAVAEFSDIPLFGRHYPTDPAEFAFDLFLGKPALAVAHHGYFRNGYEPLVTFVKRVNEIDKEIEWTSLGKLCTSACVKKTTPDGDILVRFYTDRFHLANRGTERQRYVLLRRRTSGRPVRAVTVNGSACQQEESGDDLKITLFLNPGESADIRINAADETRAAPGKVNTTRNAGVLVRRLLCELRDNHLETNPILSGLLTGLRGLRTKEKTTKGVLRPAEMRADANSIEELCG